MMLLPIIVAGVVSATQHFDEVSNGRCYNEHQAYYDVWRLHGDTEEWPLSSCETRCTGIPECRGFTYRHGNPTIAGMGRCLLHADEDMPLSVLYDDWDYVHTAYYDAYGPITGGSGSSMEKCYRRTVLPCPGVMHDRVGTSCHDPGNQCEYGNECCCGECYPSTVLECAEGSWVQRSTDTCLNMGECPPTTPAPTIIPPSPSPTMEPTEPEPPIQFVVASGTGERLVGPVCPVEYERLTLQECEAYATETEGVTWGGAVDVTNRPFDCFVQTGQNKVQFNNGVGCYNRHTEIICKQRGGNVSPVIVAYPGRVINACPSGSRELTDWECARYGWAVDEGDRWRNREWSKANAPIGCIQLYHNNVVRYNLNSVGDTSKNYLKICAIEETLGVSCPVVANGRCLSCSTTYCDNILCNEGYIDMDGSSENGCEFEATSITVTANRAICDGNAERELTVEECERVADANEWVFNGERGQGTRYPKACYMKRDVRPGVDNTILTYNRGDGGGATSSLMKLCHQG